MPLAAEFHCLEIINIFCFDPIVWKTMCTFRVSTRGEFCTAVREHVIPVVKYREDTNLLKTALEFYN